MEKELELYIKANYAKLEGDTLVAVKDAFEAAWQARVPEGYVVVHVDKLMDCLYQISDRSYIDDNVSEIKAMLEAVEK